MRLRDEPVIIIEKILLSISMAEIKRKLALNLVGVAAHADIIKEELRKCHKSTELRQTMSRKPQYRYFQALSSRSSICCRPVRDNVSMSFVLPLVS